MREHLPPLVLLLLAAACTPALPPIGDGGITCSSDKDCQPGEFCDLVDSPHFCFALPPDGGDGGVPDAGDGGGVPGPDAGDAGPVDAGIDAGCFIGGQQYTSGTADPSFACAVCDPATSGTNWSAASDGTACTNDGGTYCMGGGCVPSCLIGGALVLPGATAPDNGCQVCNPDAGSTAYTDEPELTACADAGNFCHAGECQLGCGIDGGFVASWTPQDAIVTGCCNPALSATNWTPAFGTAREVTLSAHPSGLTVADFNGDGLSDFAATEIDYTIDVYLSQSDGGLLAKSTIDFPPGTPAIVSSVLTPSAHADLALLEESVPAVQLLYGNGDGTFLDAGTIQLALVSGLNAIASVPLSGAPDLLLPANLSSFPGIEILENESGQFSGTHSAFSVGQGTSPWELAWGNFRVDAGPDVAVMNNDGSGVDVFVDNGGTLKESQLVPTIGTPQAICAAELNGDALQDFAVTSTQLGDAGVVQAYLSQGDGGFSSGPRALVGARPVAITAFRRAEPISETLAIADGKTGDVGLWVSLDGGFAPAGTYPAGSGANAISTGDFNGDGLTDLAVSDPSSSVYILYGQCR